jgi:hypothetical protein
LRWDAWAWIKIVRLAGEQNNIERPAKSAGQWDEAQQKDCEKMAKHRFL